MDAPIAWTATYDYASVIVKDGPSNSALDVWLEAMTKDAFDAGYNLRPFSAHGYEGQRLGDFSAASNAQGFWLTVSGSLAETQAPLLFRIADHATRVDLAITAEFNPRLPDLASREYHRHQAQEPGNGIRRHALILSDGGGQTFYIGSRKSQRFARLYDRGVKAETHEPGQCWRWEVEYKADRAEQVRHDLTRLDHSSTIKAGLVTDFFQTRGIAIPPLVAPTSQSEISVIRPRGVYNTLAWYEQQVKPSVERLLDAGFRDAALRALGFTQED